MLGLRSRLKGNARGCLAYEPLFLIPYSMYSTYATIYMFELGISETADRLDYDARTSRASVLIFD